MRNCSSVLRESFREMAGSLWGRTGETAGDVGSGWRTGFGLGRTSEGSPGGGTSVLDTEPASSGAGGRAGGGGTKGGAATVSGGTGGVGPVTADAGRSGIVTEGGVASETTGWSGGTGSCGIVLSIGCSATSGGAGPTTDGGMKAAVEACGAGSVTAGATWETGGAFRSVEAATTMPAPISSNRLFFNRRLAGPGCGSPGDGDSAISTMTGESGGRGGGLSSVKSSPQASQVTVRPAMETGT